jgi:nucleoid-associated protein YgaU
MSKGKHRKRHVRRAVIAIAVAGLAVLGTGIGFAAAQSPPAVVKIAGDPVIAQESSAPPAPSQAHAAPPVVYIAKQGDTFWSVSVSQCHSGNDWKALTSANHASPPYRVKPGQRITVKC